VVHRVPKTRRDIGGKVGEAKGTTTRGGVAVFLTAVVRDKRHFPVRHGYLFAREGHQKRCPLSGRGDILRSPNKGGSEMGPIMGPWKKKGARPNVQWGKIIARIGAFKKGKGKNYMQPAAKDHQRKEKIGNIHPVFCVMIKVGS